VARGAARVARLLAMNRKKRFAARRLLTSRRWREIFMKYHEFVTHTAKHAVSEGTKAVTKFESASSN